LILWIEEENKVTEMCGKTMAVLDDERMTCCIGAYEENLEHCSPCIGANEENRDHSSSGKLAWYFAQPSIPGLIYVGTINGYVASGRDKAKGGKEDV
jgi:hypothetical protein